ncbi:MAG: hypothetical protein M3235_04665 [Actinomycetota bacterium]|nr:hypothetical protein [Actinomycetota bacterium]
MPESVTHHSPAWILSGIMNTPGFLILSDGRLSFVSDGGVVFDEPLDRVTDVTFPWYYFSGGFKATIGGTRRRISLTRPNGAPDPDTGLLGGAGDLASAASSLRDVGVGRRAGKQWRALLTGPASAYRTG